MGRVGREGVTGVEIRPLSIKLSLFFIAVGLFLLETF